MPRVLVCRARSRRTFTSSERKRARSAVMKIKSRLARLLRGACKCRIVRVASTFSVVKKALSEDGTCSCTETSVRGILGRGPAVRIIVSLRESNIPSRHRLMARIGKGPATRLLFCGKLDCAIDRKTIDCLPGPCVRRGLTFSFRLRCRTTRCCPSLCQKVCLTNLHCGLRLGPQTLLLRTKTRAGAIRRIQGTVRPFTSVLGEILGNDSGRN